LFETLSGRLSGILDKLRDRGSLTEADVTAALREIRLALLEADVALSVVKTFMNELKDRAIGQNIVAQVGAGQMVAKIVNDYLVETLGEAVPLNLNATPPVMMMMVGLQGSGKTTTTAKLARNLALKDRKKVLMASLDIYRPAAQEQLETLCKTLNHQSIGVLPIVPGEKPLKITKRAIEAGKKQGYDVVLLDTAGRLHIDDELMEELESIKRLANPNEILLVADSMLGQDAVTVADHFHKRLNITGIILTRLDGDARGGAALSMRSVTGCPIKFMGLGEKIDQLEAFQPDRIAGRILGMGDVVGLVERAMEAFDQKEMDAAAQKMKKGSFDMEDLKLQLTQMKKMGGLSGLMGMLPGVSKIKAKMGEGGIDDRMLDRQIAIINSMTPFERREVKVLNASRKKRIALGSGVDVSEINKLIKQYLEMSQMMKKLGKLETSGGFKGGLSGLKGLMGF
jgi:signal recognition particle subunit SRP54